MEIHLQGIGKHYAIKAAKLVPGMTMIWNFGYTSTVKTVEASKTGKTVTVVSITPDGSEYGRRFSADRLVAVDKPL